MRRACCSPTTTAPTAASSPRLRRWPSRATAAWTSTWPRSAGEAVARPLQRGAGRGAAGARVRDRERACGEVARAARPGRAHPRAGRPTADAERCACAHGGATRCSRTSRVALQAQPGRDVSYAMQKLRDNPTLRGRGIRRDARRRRTRASRRCSRSTRRRTWRRRSSRSGARPRVAILREQGVNSQLEMAAAFTRAGFDAVDVHMSDLIAGRVSLDGLPRASSACGGFSYGDVLGAGERLGQVDPLQPARARRVRSASSRAGQLRAGRVQRLPDDGAAERADPRRRRTGRASCATRPSSSRRACRMVEIAPTPVALLRRHGGQPHAHRGRARRRPAEFASAAADALNAPGWSRLRFVDNHGRPDGDVPGQPQRLAATASPRSPRATGASRSLMPHPERVFRTVQHSWHPADGARTARGCACSATREWRSASHQASLSRPADAAMMGARSATHERGPAEQRYCIGTSGWNYPSRGLRPLDRCVLSRSSRARRFPEKSESSTSSLCAERFNTVEINNTFYRPPAAKTSQSWATRTPEGFEFSLKLFQQFTHKRDVTQTDVDVLQAWARAARRGRKARRPALPVSGELQA